MKFKKDEVLQDFVDKPRVPLRNGQSAQARGKAMKKLITFIAVSHIVAIMAVCTAWPEVFKFNVDSYGVVVWFFCWVLVLLSVARAWFVKDDDYE